MRAGPLRHLCLLRGLTETKDELNQPVKVWADIGKVWAEIKAPSGRMYEAASQMQAQINAEINIRYRRDVVAGQHLVHDGHREGVPLLRLVEIGEQCRFWKATVRRQD